MTKKKIAAIVLTGAAALAALAVGASAVKIVPAGHTGVQVRLGSVSDQVLPEGMHFVMPFVTQVVNMDNRVLKSEAQSTSASKDLQNVSSTIAVNYRLQQDSAASVFRNIGRNYEEVIIQPAILESVKAVTAQFTAEELVTERQKVSDLMKENLSEKISPYGIIVELFNIISFDFSEEFNAAIEAKQTAQQNALKAEQDLRRVEIEAQQEIEKAKAEAESYRLKNQEITENTLKMAWIEKWDGKLPLFVSEYGGTWWCPGVQGGWGYGETPQTEEEVCRRYCGLTKVLLDNPKICAFCYTQPYDIEQEQNGLFRYDRTPKFSPEIYRRIRETNLRPAAMEAR